jgi:hypothetical protein
MLARVLGEFGDDPNRYTDAKSRRNHAGTSPLTVASGKKRAVPACHVQPSPLRRHRPLGLMRPARQPRGKGLLRPASRRRRHPPPSSARPRQPDRFPLGSHRAWRMPTPLSPCLQNSHQNGGRVFLISVADPITVRSYSNRTDTEPRKHHRVLSPISATKMTANLTSKAASTDNSSVDGCL